MEVLVEPLPKIIVKPTAVDAVCHGADLSIKGIHMLDEDIRKNALVALMTARGELIAIGKMMMSSSKIMETDQGKAVDVERVFMERGHYPKMWRFSTDLTELPPE
jgi:H/ACA ribonucleoprotein complex subunit 4